LDLVTQSSEPQTLKGLAGTVGHADELAIVLSGLREAFAAVT